MTEDNLLLRICFQNVQIETSLIYFSQYSLMLGSVLLTQRITDSIESGRAEHTACNNDGYTYGYQPDEFCPRLCWTVIHWHTNSNCLTLVDWLGPFVLFGLSCIITWQVNAIQRFFQTLTILDSSVGFIISSELRSLHKT